jgi:hypothetical protein
LFQNTLGLRHANVAMTEVLIDHEVIIRCRFGEILSIGLPIVHSGNVDKNIAPVVKVSIIPDKAHENSIDPISFMRRLCRETVEICQEKNHLC